jgi:hypothetical protein
MIEFTHATTRYTVKPENAQEYRRLAAKPPAIKRKVDRNHDAMRRSYPIFEPGMTTDDYVSLFNGLNSRLLLTPWNYDNVSGVAPMLDPTQPEVLEELDPDYVPDFLNTTAKPKKQTVADLRRSIQSALDLLQAGDVDMAQCVLSEALK